jgi:archaellum component FlaC
MEYIRVKDKNNLVRDTYSNGIVNTDYENYKKYVDSYKRKMEESKRIENLESELSNIKNDLNEIKSLLRNFANGS